MQVINAFTEQERGLRSRQRIDVCILVRNECSTDDAAPDSGHIHTTIDVHVTADNLCIAGAAELMLVVIDARPGGALVIAAIETKRL